MRKFGWINGWMFLQNHVKTTKRIWMKLEKRWIIVQNNAWASFYASITPKFDYFRILRGRRRLQKLSS